MEDKMNPIINPSFFYWLNVVDGIITLFTVVTVFVSIACLMISLWGLIIWTANSHCGDDDRDVITGKKLVRIGASLFAVVVFLFLAISFIPSKDTLIQMAVAKNLTYDRVGKVISSGKALKDEVKNDIIDILKAAGKKGE
jgi:hypothetical protein